MKIKQRGEEKSTSTIDVKAVSTLIWAAASVAIAVGVFKTGATIKHLPMFKLQTVEISGAKNTQREAILSVAGLSEGVNLLSLKMSEIRSAVEALPWIENAEIGRQFPSKILIKVKEREPAFILRLEKDLFYLSSDARVIEAPLEQGLDFAVVTGISQSEIETDGFPRKSFLSLLSVLETGGLGDEPSEIHMDPVEGFIVYTAETGGMGVKFGFSDFSERMNKLKKLKRHLEKRSRAAYAINLTYEDKIIARLTPEERKGSRQ